MPKASSCCSHRIRRSTSRGRRDLAHGAVVRSWLLELAARGLTEDGSDLDDIAGYVEDSGEGRWTMNEAIEDAVPMPVLSRRSSRASLAARDRSGRRWRRRCGINSAATPCAAVVRGQERQTGGEQSARGGLASQPQAGSLRDGDLRRVGRSDAAQALSGALRARLSPPAARAASASSASPGPSSARARSRRRCGKRSRVRARPIRARRLGRVRRRHSLRRHRLRLGFRGRHGAGALDELDEERGTAGNRLYYLAVPPQAFETVVRERASGARARAGCA